jgi:single-strand DNA-binding protein
MAQITVQGNIGKDPEIKFSGDLGITKFSVAETPRTKNKTTGQWEDGETIWFNVTVFGSQAEVVVDNYAKGDTVLVIGKFRQSTYTDKNGETRTSLEINAESIAKVARSGKSAPAKPAPQEEVAPW